MYKTPQFLKDSSTPSNTNWSKTLTVCRKTGGGRGGRRCQGPESPLRGSPGPCWAAQHRRTALHRPATEDVLCYYCRTEQILTVQLGTSAFAQRCDFVLMGYYSKNVSAWGFAIRIFPSSIKQVTMLCERCSCAIYLRACVLPLPLALPSGLFYFLVGKIKPIFVNSFVKETTFFP